VSVAYSLFPQSYFHYQAYDHRMVHNSPSPQRACVCNATVGISDKCKTLTPMKHTQQKLMFSFAEQIKFWAIHIELWVSLHFRSEGIHFSFQEEEFRVAPKNHRLTIA